MGFALMCAVFVGVDPPQDFEILTTKTCAHVTCSLACLSHTGTPFCCMQLPCMDMCELSSQLSAAASCALCSWSWCDMLCDLAASLSVALEYVCI